MEGKHGLVFHSFCTRERLLLFKWLHLKNPEKDLIGLTWIPCCPMDQSTLASMGWVTVIDSLQQKHMLELEGHSSKEGRLLFSEYGEVPGR